MTMKIIGVVGVLPSAGTQILISPSQFSEIKPVGIESFFFHSFSVCGDNSCRYRDFIYDNLSCGS